jgi:hypothetical protein
MIMILEVKNHFIYTDNQSNIQDLYVTVNSKFYKSVFNPTGSCWTRDIIEITESEYFDILNAPCQR